jgi:D-psicose/D-tagatose/L-ribulose 3-epimerase
MVVTLNRRQLLTCLAATAVLPRVLAATGRFRLAICNETFQGWTFAEMCQGARRLGYTGLEIAPFTLGDDAASLPVGKRRELRRTMASEGIAYVGLHAILTAPRGLHVTTPDVGVRQRSWEYVRRLVDLAADLGDSAIVVFGSGKQRSATSGASVVEATARFQEGLAGLAPAAQARGVTILIEALAPHLSDVVTTLDEAVAIVKHLGSPAIQTMFDTHNAVKEPQPHGALIKKHSRYIRHVHINEMDGRHPGTGSYDFKGVLQALKELSYRHWVSLEVFDFSAGPEAIARESARLVRQWESELALKAISLRQVWV